MVSEADVAGKTTNDEPYRNHKRRVPYCLGEKRVATLALLTFTALSG